MAVKYGSIWVKLPIDVEHWSRVVYSLVIRAEVKTRIGGTPEPLGQISCWCITNR